MIKIGTFSLKTRKVSEKLWKNKIMLHYINMYSSSNSNYHCNDNESPIKSFIFNINI